MRSAFRPCSPQPLLVVVALSWWVICYCWYLSLGDLRSHAALEVSMRAQASGTCQLFYDLGRGFNEEDSIKRNFSAETDALLSFPLPPGVISKLRFDPTDQLGWVRLNSARVLQGGRQEVEISLGNALLTNDVGETRLEEGSLRLHVLNRDPWVVLPMHGALEVRREWRVLFLFLTIAVAGTLTFAYLALRYARGGAGVVGGRSIAVYLGILGLVVGRFLLGHCSTLMTFGKRRLHSLRTGCLKRSGVSRRTRCLWWDILGASRWSSPRSRLWRRMLASWDCRWILQSAAWPF